MKEIYFGGIKFSVRKKNVRYYRIELSPEKAVITAPPFCNVSGFLEANRNKILKKKEEILRRIEKCDSVSLSSRTDEIFKNLISEKVEKFASVLGVRFSEIRFREMKRTLGNCRHSGVLTFNKKLRFMPSNVIEYIVFHELLHLKIKGGHNKEFRRKILAKFPDKKDLDETINIFMMKINRKESNIRAGCLNIFN